ncbi:MAG TPA: GntR family transcriptional regulator [Phycisphaerae bacterium]|nr:GntR family transcriptional regulator [Phycisphaerae bacterium]HRY68618.1 GntR family transcriptional regulator [Phycisphaerae bacterium]HSA25667.1 GntR family transcriptional regulator [Phycisphaerae bacterium]
MSIPQPDRASLRERAYQRLRRLLVLEQLPAGERLRETEWAERLEVNRAALREAFARLEAEGFLKKGAKTGYFVPDLRAEDILEIIEVRIMLEGGAIERVVRLGKNNPQELRLMIEACSQLERLVHEEYLLGVAEADRRFHEALVNAAGNRRLAILYERAPLPIIHPLIITGEQWKTRVQQTLDEHRAVLEAILDGNVALGQQLLRTHLDQRAFVPLYAG